MECRKSCWLSLRQIYLAVALLPLLLRTALLASTPLPSVSAAPPAAQLKQQQQRIQSGTATASSSCTFNIQGSGTMTSPQLLSAAIDCRSGPGATVTVVGGSLLQPFSDQFTGEAQLPQQASSAKWAAEVVGSKLLSRSPSQQ